MAETLHHATITLERFYDAPPERVFSEFADPATRAKWSAPSNDALVYDRAEFREGGGDVFRCGPANDLKFLGETRYQVIIPNSCIISTETVSEGGKRLAVALNTLSFDGGNHGTTLKITIQMISFAGPGIIDSYKSGNQSALNGLARRLSAGS